MKNPDDYVVLDLDNLALTRWLPKRRKDAAKWDFGHVLVLGGDLGMPGATRLAGEAALRTGAGMVSVLTRPEQVNGIFGACPELMVHGVAEPDRLAGELDSEAGGSVLLSLLSRAQVLVLGPGLGHGNWGRVLLQSLMSSRSDIRDQAWVLDADGLNLLAERRSRTGVAFPASNNGILTPHVREASRLLGCPVEEIEANRYVAVKNLQAEWGGIIVLKGHETLIAGPEGPVFINRLGNPGMASAGMGDVLSGIIGGLLAQQIPPFEAAKIGVYLHALAGDRAANQGERGMKASDLLPHIREFVNWNNLKTERTDRLI